MMRGIYNFHSRKWRHTDGLTMRSVAQWLERLLYIWKVGTREFDSGAAWYCNEIQMPHFDKKRPFYRHFVNLLKIWTQISPPLPEPRGSLS